MGKLVAYLIRFVAYMLWVSQLLNSLRLLHVCYEKSFVYLIGLSASMLW